MLPAFIACGWTPDWCMYKWSSMCLCVFVCVNVCVYVFMCLCMSMSMSLSMSVSVFVPAAASAGIDEIGKYLLFCRSVRRIKKLVCSSQLESKCRVETQFFRLSISLFFGLVFIQDKRSLFLFLYLTASPSLYLSWYLSLSAPFPLSLPFFPACALALALAFALSVLYFAARVCSLSPLLALPTIISRSCSLLNPPPPSRPPLPLLLSQCLSISKSKRAGNSSQTTCHSLQRGLFVSPFLSLPSHPLLRNYSRSTLPPPLPPSFSLHLFLSPPILSVAFLLSLFPLFLPFYYSPPRLYPLASAMQSCASVWNVWFISVTWIMQTYDQILSMLHTHSWLGGICCIHSHEWVVSSARMSHVTLMSRIHMSQTHACVISFFLYRARRFSPLSSTYFETGLDGAVELLTERQVFKCVPWLIHMCDVTHSHVCHDSLM